MSPSVDYYGSQGCRKVADQRELDHPQSAGNLGAITYGFSSFDIFVDFNISGIGVFLVIILFFDAILSTPGIALSTLLSCPNVYF